MHLETIMFTWEIGPTKEKPLYKRSLSIHCSITHLDFICIHWSVCNEDLCIFYSFWLIYTDLLVKQKSCYDSEKREFLLSKTFDSFKKLSSLIKIGMLLTTTYLHPSMSQPGFHQVFWWSEWHPSFHCPEISRKTRLLSTSNHMFQM